MLAMTVTLGSCAGRRFCSVWWVLDSLVGEDHIARRISTTFATLRTVLRVRYNVVSVTRHGGLCFFIAQILVINCRAVGEQLLGLMRPSIGNIEDWASQSLHPTVIRVCREKSKNWWPWGRKRVLGHMLLQGAERSTNLCQRVWKRCCC